MRPNVYLLLAWRHARLSAALLAVVLVMGACGAFTTIGGASSFPRRVSRVSRDRSCRSGQTPR